VRIVLLDNDTLNLKGVEEGLREFGDVQIYHSTSEDELPSRIKEADIVLTNKVVLDKVAIDGAEKLKMISILATGTNNVDLEYAKKKGIVVENVTDYSTDSVTQHTFTCLFSLLGQVSHQDSYVKSKTYSDSVIFTHLNYPFSEINGKKFGVIGLGNIGSKVATIATAFGCEVFYYSTSGKNNSSLFKRVDLDIMLKECDIVSIHAPLNDDTEGLIGEPELEKMKDNSVLINMGRGGIVNEMDLAESLINGGISGACLDVYENEPISTDNPLLNPEISGKLIMTPHIAWASIEAREKLWEKTLGNIRRFLQNEIN